MKRIVSMLLAVLLSGSIVNGQRVLEIVGEGTPSASPRNAVLNGKIIIAGHGETFLTSYNDILLTVRYYPFADGRRLVYYNNDNDICKFRSAIYTTLTNTVTDERYLYRYNGIGFTRITVPGSIVSGCAVLGDNLYVLSRMGEATSLFRYNGTSTTEASPAVLPGSYQYALVTANNYLYILGLGIPYTSVRDIVKRFNGTVTSTLPYFNIGGSVPTLVPVGETGKIYFFTRGDSSRIVYFNGSSVADIYDLTGWDSGVILRGDLYFISNHGWPVVASLYKAIEGVVTEISSPAGGTFSVFGNAAVYRDTIYAVVSYGDTRHELQKFDGTNFLPVFTIPGEGAHQPDLFLREGKLMILPRPHNGDTAFEYNGSRITSIRAPSEDYSLTSYINSTFCNHLWMSRQYVDTLGEPLHILLKEPKVCAPRAIIPIPDYLRRYLIVDLGLSATGRKWTWTAMGFNWDNSECATPPCTSTFEAAFTDVNGKVALKHAFSKPFNVAIPLKDDKAYTVSLSAIEKNSTQPLFVMDYNLVPKGISAINLSMKPDQDYFKLSAQTVNGIPVPLKAVLFNKLGKPIWEKTFTAPFSTIINDTLQEAGQVLYFYVPQTQQQKTESDITSFSFYPNPSRGQLNIEVKTNGEIIDTEVSVTSLHGEILLKKNVQAPFRQSLTLPPRKPGMYVLKIKTGEEEISKLIQLE